MRSSYFLWPSLIPKLRFFCFSNVTLMRSIAIQFKLKAQGQDGQASNLTFSVFVTVVGRVVKRLPVHGHVANGNRLGEEVHDFLMSQSGQILIVQFDDMVTRQDSSVAVSYAVWLDVLDNCGNKRRIGATDDLQAKIIVTTVNLNLAKSTRYDRILHVLFDPK